MDQSHQALSRQTQRLESLGHLAAGVAHDFNNLLAVISNSAAFVVEDLDAAVAEGDRRWLSSRRDVTRIERAAERAAALARQLLTFSHPEPVEPRVIDPNEVVRDVEELLRRSIGKHIQLTVGTGEDVPPVLVDPGQLEQVLVNLAVNARDAMPAGGTLLIDSGDIMISDGSAADHPPLSPGRYARLRVSDTGTGMPTHVREQAFEPFFTTKAASEGTGLGLATVYGIITGLGGQVQIFSEPGLGTSVTMLVPAVVAPAQPEARQPGGEAPTAPGRGETILIVDDLDVMREVSQRVLERRGFRVLTAVDGAEARRLADAHPGPIDLLLTNVVMPGLLGGAVAEAVARSRPGIPVLFMSGYTAAVLIERGFLPPGARLVTKPFSGPALVQAVRERLDEARQRSG